MTTAINRIWIREMRPKIECIWFTGRNAIDVARFLQDNGKTAKVELHPFGENLIIDGKRIDVPKDEEGVWLGADRVIRLQHELTDTYEVVESR